MIKKNIILLIIFNTYVDDVMNVMKHDVTVIEIDCGGVDVDVDVGVGVGVDVDVVDVLMSMMTFYIYILYSYY